MIHQFPMMSQGNQVKLQWRAFVVMMELSMFKYCGEDWWNKYRPVMILGCGEIRIAGSMAVKAATLAWNFLNDQNVYPEFEVNDVDFIVAKKYHSLITPLVTQSEPPMDVASDDAYLPLCNWIEDVVTNRYQYRRNPRVQFVRLNGERGDIHQFLELDFDIDVCSLSWSPSDGLKPPTPLRFQLLFDQIKKKKATIQESALDVKSLIPGLLPIPFRLRKKGIENDYDLWQTSEWRKWKWQNLKNRKAKYESRGFTFDRHPYHGLPRDALNNEMLNEDLLSYSSLNSKKVKI